MCRIAFSVVESVYFHALLNSISPIAPAIPRSADTIRNWSLSRYEAAKAEIKLILAAALSLINLSLDCWSSPNNIAIIAIVAHFIDSFGRPQKALLALRELPGL